MTTMFYRYDLGFEGHEPRTSRVGRRLILWPAMWGQLQEFARDNDVNELEARVLVCVAHGMTNPATATELEVSVESVKHCLRRLFVRFHVDDRAQLVTKAFLRGGFARVFKGLPT